jgi:hypothetical protein
MSAAEIHTVIKSLVKIEINPMMANVPERM